VAGRKPTTPRARSVASLTALRAQLRIELRGVKPLVWRRILVPETVTLAKLHGILQWTMGWMNSHLHEYEIAHQRYGVPDSEWEPSGAVTDERRARLKPLLEAGLRRFTYLYDFGDHWEHLVKVEDLVPPRDGLQPIVCLAGENACPPEDVGGVPGYADFLAALADPKHEEHVSMREWIGYPFDPTAFDLVAVNKILATIKP
jgi:Plasmid pRiA4b ORF-3-like protein